MEHDGLLVNRDSALETPALSFLWFLFIYFFFHFRLMNNKTFKVAGDLMNLYQGETRKKAAQLINQKQINKRVIDRKSQMKRNEDMRLRASRRARPARQTRWADMRAGGWAGNYIWCQEGSSHLKAKWKWFIFCSSWWASRRLPASVCCVAQNKRLESGNRGGGEGGAY